MQVVEQQCGDRSIPDAVTPTQFSASTIDESERSRTERERLKLVGGLAILSTNGAGNLVNAPSHVGQ
ncbi:MAG: hypothetical protein OXG65_00035 [Chloroflexi bacterium]|nr:hypothetical protein [Chloroflexota bacterium]